MGSCFFYRSKMQFCCALVFSISPSIAQDAGNGEDQPDANVIGFAPNSLDCPPPADIERLGATPENPISLRSLQPLRDTLDKRLKPKTDGKPVDNQYNCKWVKVAIYFRWRDAEHFRGKVYENSSIFYTQDLLDVTIESFSDPSVNRLDLQATDTEIVGQFYDLCAAKKAERERAEREDNAYILDFGLCNHGQDVGLMLKDVRVLSISPRGPKILTGEQNRDVVGDLYTIPTDNEYHSHIQATAIDWLNTLRKGKAAMLEAIRLKDPDFPNNHFDRECWAAGDSWTGRLIERIASGTLTFDRRIEDLPFQAFTGWEDWNGELSDLRRFESVGCFCLREDCTDRWPLIRADASRLAKDFLCTPIYYNDGEWSWPWGLTIAEKLKLTR